MRALVCLLLWVGAARADMTTPVTTPGDIVRMPATDGKRIATQLTSFGGTAIVTFLDVRTGRSHDETLDASRLARRLAHFRPMAVREVSQRDDQAPRSPDYDPDRARLHVGGRTLDLMIRDTCFDEPRQRVPRTVTVYEAPNVALVEYWSNAGSCMCSDPTEQQLVAHGRIVALR